MTGDTATATKSMPRWMLQGTWFMWVVVTAGIWTWLAHLIFTASMVEHACVHSGRTWTMHLATVVLAALTIAAGWGSWLMMKLGAEPEHAADVPGRTLFLGRLGLLTNTTGLIAILLEGVFTLFISPCA